MGSFSAGEARLARLRKRLKASGLEGAVVVPGPNMTYFTGVTSLLLERPFMLLVPAAGEPQLVAPELEAGPYRRSRTGMKVHGWTDSEGSRGATGTASKMAGVEGRWGVEGKVPFLFLSKLSKAASAEFVDAEPLLQELREVKDPEEVRLLKKAASILSRSFEAFPSLVKAGVKETDLGRAATEVIYEKGATKVDAMLVQSGPNASDPHGLPTSKKVRAGEGVVIDVGATFEGYYADITRTICVGRADEVEKVYARVLEAEEAGIAAAAAGVEVGAVDGAARGLLRKAGLGKYFIHRTGHGLGLEVHEAPYIVEGGKEKLREGMCFTVEPGVYVPGKLGVRIEDNVLVEKGKGLEITGTPKEFGWWK